MQRNVTISLDDDLARWLRVAAAEADVSVSQYLATMVEDRRAQAQRNESALAAWRKRPMLRLRADASERFPSRDLMNERPPRLRRH